MFKLSTDTGKTVLVDADELEHPASPGPKLQLVEFLESLNMEGLDLTREPDTGFRMTETNN